MDPSGHDPRDAYDRLAYHLPTASEIERMGGFYQDWQLRYNQAITSDQRWELIDLKDSYLNLSEGTFVEDLWNFICENPAYATGAIVGGATAGIVLVMSGSIMVYPFASAATIIVAGATGGFVVGETATAIDNFSIEQELKKLGYDINEMTVYNLDKMPEEVWQLCEDYYDNTQKQQLYMDLSIRAMQLASILYLTEGVYQAGITMAQYLADRSAEGTRNVVTNKFPNDPSDAGWKVSYTIEDGKIKIDNWQGQKNYDFVINQDGTLVIGSKHSYLADNKDVLAAGQLKIDNQGNLRNIINSSGHYQSTPTEALQFPELFKNVGVNTKNAWLEAYEWISDSSGTVVDFYKAYSMKIED